VVENATLNTKEILAAAGYFVYAWRPPAVYIYVMRCKSIGRKLEIAGR
jgi:hypothetical protein